VVGSGLGSLDSHHRSGTLDLELGIFYERGVEEHGLGTADRGLSTNLVAIGLEVTIIIAPSCTYLALLRKP